jgi:hypothetical protein
MSECDFKSFLLEYEFGFDPAPGFDSISKLPRNILHALLNVHNAESGSFFTDSLISKPMPLSA